MALLWINWGKGEYWGYQVLATPGIIVLRLFTEELTLSVKMTVMAISIWLSYFIAGYALHVFWRLTLRRR